MEAIAGYFALKNLKNELAGLLKQPLFYVALALLALGIGTYAYLDHAQNKAVATAVKNSNTQATIQAYQTKDQAEAALVPIQAKEQAKAAQTQKDYSNVRTVIVTAQAPQRNAQVPRLVIDTLNNLERVSRERRNESAVPDPDVHAK